MSVGGPTSPRLRFRGVVAGAEGAVPVADAVLVLSGSDPVALAPREPFDLVLADGDRLRVEPAAGADLQMFGPERSLRGKWAELDGEPLARLFRDRAPGPHVTAKLAGRCFAVGDTIEVVAEVTEHEAVDGPAAPREAPLRRVSAVRAVAIAFGDDASRKIDELCRQELRALSRAAMPERRPFEWKRWVVVALVVGALGVLAVAMISSRVVVVDVLSLLAAVGVGGYEAFDETAQLPVFRAATERRLHPDRVWAGVLSVLLVVGAAVTTLVHVVAALSDEPVGHPLVAPLAAAGALVVSAIALLASTRYSARLAALFLTAPPHGGGAADGAWGLASGVVRDPTPLTTTKVPTAMAFAKSGGDWVLATEGTFFVDTDAGPIEVDPRGALWASRIVEVGTEGEERTAEEIVPIGAQVAVVGRVKRGPDGGALLASTGPESLLLLATPADAPPLELIRRSVRARRNLTLLLAGTAAAIVGVALAVLRLL